MIIDWKAVKQYFTVVLFVFQFHPVCNFGTFLSFGLDTVRSERVKLGCLPEKESAFNENRTHVLQVIGAMLYQLSHDHNSAPLGVKGLNCGLMIRWKG